MLLTTEDTIVLVEQQLRQHPHLTLTEAASLTGLSVADARDALDALLVKYVCRLQVSEFGDLIYHFGDRLRRRGVKTWADRWKASRQWLWRAFTIFFRAWITVTLVVYFVLFIALLILTVITARSGRSAGGRNLRARPGRTFGPLLRMFLSILNWRTITGTIDRARDRHGYRYQHYQPEPGVLKPLKKNFVAAVYDFVFGPPRVKIGPLRNEKEVAAYLRRNKGIVVAAELSALAGWTFEEAETFLTDCVVRYEGETKISDQAVLYGQFDTITRWVDEGPEGSSNGPEEQVVYYWDEYEPEYELTGNSVTHNAMVIGLNTANLLFSLLVLNGSFTDLLETQLPIATASGPLVFLVFGWLPLVFSGLFFLIPAARFFSVRAMQSQQHQQNIRKRLFHAVFAQQGQAQTTGEVLGTLHAANERESLAAPVVEERLKELVLDMPGSLRINDAAELEFSFPRITRELRAALTLRRQRQLDHSLGDIVIESDN